MKANINDEMRGWLAGIGWLDLNYAQTFDGAIKSTYTIGVYFSG
jgi:hypothetical protein